MSKKLVSSAVISILTLITFLVFLPTDAVFAQIADGTYKVNYEMKEAGNNNTSIADGYFSKPATLTVQNGKQYIQIKVTGSNYIKSLTAPSGPVQIISDDTANHTRVVKFRVDGDLAKPLTMGMHIVVPDLYDMNHKARAVFNVSHINQAETAAKKQTKSTQNPAKASAAEKQKEAKQKEERKLAEEKEKAAAAKKAEQAKELEKAKKAEEAKQREDDAKKAKQAQEAEARKKEDAKTVQKEKQSETVDNETKSASMETKSSENSNTAIIWIAVIIILIGGIAGFLLIQKKRKNNKGA